MSILPLHFSDCPLMYNNAPQQYTAAIIWNQEHPMRGRERARVRERESKGWGLREIPKVKERWGRCSWGMWMISQRYKAELTEINTDKLKERWPHWKKEGQPLWSLAGLIGSVLKPQREPLIPHQSWHCFFLKGNKQWYVCLQICLNKNK